MNRKRNLLLFIIIFSLITCGIPSVNASPYRQTDEVIELSPRETENEGSENIIAEESIPETPSETEEAESSEAESEETPVPPEAPEAENPQGEFRSKAMGFYWRPSLNADYYEVAWQNDRGYSDILQIKNEDWTCQMGLCILYAELPSDGNYTWSVTAVNEGGNAVSEEMNFSIPSLIPAPDAYRPNSTLDNQKPIMFEWEDVGYNAAAFRIQIADVNTDRIRMDIRYSSDEVNCMNGVCFIETDEYLASGSYVWRIQVSNGREVSGWSGWVPFEETCTECNLGTYLNTTTISVFPKGIINDPTPEFVWKTVTGAANYQLEIKNPQEKIIFDENISSENCAVELCTFTPEINMEPGEGYTWSVTTYGWNNSFWGTDAGMFSIVLPDIEFGELKFIEPGNNVFLDPDNKQIIWSDPGPAAAAFRLGIRDDHDEWLFTSDLTREDAWCDGITCSIQFYEIPEGQNYEIIVIPYSEYNSPGDAVSLTFNNQAEKGEE